MANVFGILAVVFLLEYLWYSKRNPVEPPVPKGMILATVIDGPLKGKVFYHVPEHVGVIGETLFIEGFPYQLVNIKFDSPGTRYSYRLAKPQFNSNRVKGK